METITVKVKILPFEYFTEETDRYKKDLQIDIPKESTINSLFLKLSQELGDFFQKLIYNPQTLSLVQTTIVFINGRVLQSLDGWNTKLSNGDIVVIGRMYTGG